MALVNNLIRNVARNDICTALGVKLITTPDIAMMAKSAGYDSLFIELEHSSFSLSTASMLCSAGLAAGITPFVRVPHQCGHGFVQRVLDGGAMGVIFPHISSLGDAKDAISICKFPPFGKRSLTASLPQFGFRAMPPKDLMMELDTLGSTTFLMIETLQGLANVDEIAALPGCDVLLVGSNDLSLELGVLGQWDSDVFRSALRKIGQACKRHGKVLGLAGLYTRPDICAWAIQELNAGYFLGNLDVGLLAAAMKDNVAGLKALKS